MQDIEKPRGSGRRRLFKGVLVASLALNLAFAGLFAGAFIRHGGSLQSAAGHPGTGAFGAPYMLALPREDRRAIFRQMHDASSSPLPDRKARRELFRDVLASLRATPFTQAALTQAVSRQAEVSVAVLQGTQEAWIAHVVGMDDAQRRAYADAIEEVLRRGPRRK